MNDAEPEALLRRVAELKSDADDIVIDGPAGLSGRHARNHALRRQGFLALCAVNS